MAMSNENIGRRGFFQAAAGAAAFTILKPHLVRGMQANSAVRVGLLGCGGRGTTHAETILHDTDARLIAVGDMFQDRLDKAKEHIDKLSAAKGHAGVEQTFVGPKAYQQVIESKLVDAVVIATPPYFHVEHLDMEIRRCRDDHGVHQLRFDDLLVRFWPNERLLDT